MGTRYSTAKVPDMNDPTQMLELEPDLTNLMYSGASEATAESFESQKYYWEQWWNTAGQGHDDYTEFVELRSVLSYALFTATLLTAAFLPASLC